MTRTMIDAVEPAALSRHQADAVAGYVNGKWPTFPRAKALGKPTLSIAVNATADAQCLDVEPGDATPAQAAAWVDRQAQRSPGVVPWVYCSRGNVSAVIASLGHRRVMLWIAHPNGVAHICTPASCGVPRAADATQHTWLKDVDISMVSDAAFATIPGAPKTASAPAKTSSAAPQTFSVMVLQSEMNRLFPRYSKLKVDGLSGPATTAVVREFQKRSGLTVDGVVGPVTLAALRKLGARV